MKPVFNFCPVLFNREASVTSHRCLSHHFWTLPLKHPHPLLVRKYLINRSYTENKVQTPLPFPHSGSWYVCILYSQKKRWDATAQCFGIQCQARIQALDFPQRYWQRAKNTILTKQKPTKQKVTTTTKKATDLGRERRHFEDANLRGRVFAMKFLSLRSYPTIFPRSSHPKFFKL